MTCAAAAAAVQRVRDLHREEFGCCSHCGQISSVPWPCDTIRALGDDSSRTVEGKADILDTVTGPIDGNGHAVSLWSAEPAVVAGFIASVVTASEQAQRMTVEEANALPVPVVKALATLHGAVRSLTAAFELAAYPMRLVFDAAAEPTQPPQATFAGAHTCVTLPTERAQRLGILVATRADPGAVIATAEQITDHVNLMRSRSLCLSCGYPLDNTPPHPLARSSGAPSSSEETE